MEDYHRCTYLFNTLTNAERAIIRICGGWGGKCSVDYLNIDTGFSLEEMNQALASIRAKGICKLWTEVSEKNKSVLVAKIGLTHTGEWMYEDNIGYFKVPMLDKSKATKWFCLKRMFTS